MGVWTKLFGGTESCRERVRATYARYVQAAKNDHGRSPYSPHVIGLYSALGTRYMARGTKVKMRDVWCELTPFLVMEEQEAAEALAEYVVFKENPADTQVTWLRNSINTALAGLSDDSYRRMATMGMLNGVAWCALLTADTAEMIEIWSDSFKHEDEAEEHPVRFDPSLPALPGNGRGKH